MPGLPPGDIINNTWAGCVANSPLFNAYGAAFSEWTVPTVSSGYPSGCPSWNLSYDWVGLDGAPPDTNDIVQAGTMNEAWYYEGPAGGSDCILGPATIAAYSEWTQLLPNQGNPVVNFGVNPGDEMHAEVWVGDSAGNLTLLPESDRRA
jgi:hypothetical protein